MLKETQNQGPSTRQELDMSWCLALPVETLAQFSELEKKLKDEEENIKLVCLWKPSFIY